MEKSTQRHQHGTATRALEQRELIGQKPRSRRCDRSTFGRSARNSRRTRDLTMFNLSRAQKPDP